MWWRSFTTSTASRDLLGKKWDALIIGAGHNGLTAAAYLARGGLSVAVLERRHVIGGAAVTEELIPGFKFSRCSYLQSLLRPTVIKELELGRHGLKLLKRNPSSFTPCLDGRYLLLGPNKELNHSEISKFSIRDANAYPRYENQLEKFCEFMDPFLDSPPPESLQRVSSFNVRFKDKMYKSAFWARLLRGAFSLGQNEMVDFMDLLLSPASKVLNKWFETDVLKATLGTDAVIGSTGSIHTPGSGYVLLHHVMGETDGDRGIWSYVEGGMGLVSLAISNAAREAGAHIVTNAEVSEMMINDSGAVNGVLLADGRQVLSSVVLSNATPYKTFMELVPNNVLPEDFVRALKYSDYSSATTKINIAVDKLPQFRCCKLNHPDAGPQHMGTIHIGSESMEEIDLACQDAVNGLPSKRPVIEMTIPSALDKIISPPGKHVINLFIQYTPYSPSDGSWRDPAYRESFAQRCFNMIDEYAPGFNSSIIGYDMLTPPDLEREIGLTGGNIFHGAMGLDSLFLMRPVKGWSNYRTPLQGLYLCGSGSHPGGGVMGAPGRNAAHVVLQDVKNH
ncbi:pyridine nucleotide-disulfide oxidoreductase domain-containing protein 2 [Ricinus communis]|uniref:Phytoene dehydrogenase, putative n=1 Tax=Ricinus communis TaxID=3988 RepID=B9S6H4_RICCO|nr:pyridine nucleotide-disulfide oxidoreductase domain-containing protein 2 [Ricinus communis]EEF40864.1 phytoene dehydrogenase, putative [Ricinus communis]|eukprot:XP_002521593.1 pyridine nucleotide-disulfide oxidoreductase domain-containing protein 2 [Ricinus communis]